MAHVFSTAKKYLNFKSACVKWIVRLSQGGKKANEEKNAWNNLFCSFCSLLKHDSILLHTMCLCICTFHDESKQQTQRHWKKLVWNRRLNHQMLFGIWQSFSPALRHAMLRNFVFIFIEIDTTKLYYFFFQQQQRQFHSTKI